MLTLINELNKNDFRAFPQKADPTKLTLSVADAAGTRYFLTRVANGLNEDGTPKYQWARGAAMRPAGEQAPIAAPVAPVAAPVATQAQAPLPQV